MRCTRTVDTHRLLCEMPMKVLLESSFHHGGLLENNFDLVGHCNRDVETSQNCVLLRYVHLHRAHVRTSIPTRRERAQSIAAILACEQRINAVQACCNCAVECSHASFEKDYAILRIQ